MRPVGVPHPDLGSPNGGEVFGTMSVCKSSKHGSHPTQVDGYERGKSSVFSLNGREYQVYAEVFCNNMENGHKWWNGHACCAYARAFVRSRFSQTESEGDFSGIVNGSARSNVVRCDLICNEDTGIFTSPNGETNTTFDIDLAVATDPNNKANSVDAVITIANSTYKLKTWLVGGGGNLAGNTTIPPFPGEIYAGFHVHTRQVKCYFELSKMSNNELVAGGDFREELQFVSTTKALMEGIP